MMQAAAEGTGSAVQPLGGANPARLDGCFTAGRDRAERKGEVDLRPAAVMSFIQVKEGDTLKIETQAAGCDLDGTIAADTVNNIHDGPGGKYAIALAQCLHYEELLHKVGGESANELQERSKAAGFPEPGRTPFTHETWRDFQELCGALDELTCDRMAGLASEKFGSRFSGQTLDSIKKTILDEHLETFLHMTSPLKGCPEALSVARQSGVRFAICSTSAEAFCLAVIRSFGIDSSFDHVISRADKHDGADRYCGDSVRITARMLKKTPEQIVFFGDSFNDVAAAALAGVKDIIIICGPDGTEQAQEKCAKKLEQASNEELQGDSEERISGVRVWLIESWEQLEIKNSQDGLPRMEVLRKIN